MNEEITIAPDQIAKKLIELITEKNGCIVWIGAGLSKGPDYPDWSDLIKSLCEKCGVVPPDLEKNKYSESEFAELLIQKAEECKKSNGQNYKEFLAQTFGKSVVYTRDAYNLLIKIPFKGYVTTNFDRLLYRVGELNNVMRIYPYPSLPVKALGEGERSIFYIHGIAMNSKGDPCGENLILAASDFDAAYKDGGIVSSFLTQIFTYENILFVGCTLSEPPMIKIFQRVREIHKQIKLKFSEEKIKVPTRFILQKTHYITDKEQTPPEPKRDFDRERDEEIRFEEMGIKVIRYDPSDMRHPEIENIFEKILKLLKHRPEPSIINSGLNY